MDIFDVLEVCDPFTIFAVVVDADRRTADEGLDGGLSFFCGLAVSLANANRFVIFFSLLFTLIKIGIFNCLPSGVMPVPAMLDGRGFLVPCVERRCTIPEVVVEVDIALPGRDAPTGVTSPDRDPVH